MNSFIYLHIRHRLCPLRAVLLAFVLFAVLGIVGCTSEKGAADLWKEERDALADLQIIKVEIRADGPQSVMLQGEEARSFADALLVAEFSEDNPNNYGPTASLVAAFYYSDNTRVVIPQWPDGRFQVQRQGRQYLISAPELTRLISAQGFEARSLR